MLSPAQFQYLSLFTNLSAILLLTAISFLRDKKYNFLISSLIILIISQLYGYRLDTVGLDSLQYAKLFSAGYSDRDDIEPVLLMIAKFVGFFTENYQIFFTVVCLIINYFVLCSFKKLDNKYYPIICAIYFSTFLFININVNIIRQGLAIAFSFYALTCYLTNNSKKKFIIYSLLALMSHLSSIFFLISVFFVRLRLTNIIVISYVSVVLLSFTINISHVVGYLSKYHLIFNKLYWYLTWPYLVEWHLKHFYYYVFMLTMVCTIMINRKRIILPKFMYPLVNIMLFGIIVLLIFRVDEMLADRIFYFYLLPCIYLSYGLYNVLIRYLRKYTIIITVVLIFFVMLVMIKSNYQYYTWFVTQEAIK